MAAPRQDGILPVSFWADAVLSTYQYYAVTAASTEDYVKRATGASNPVPIGILQDKDGEAVGDGVAVKTFGFTKAVVAACDIAGNGCAIKYGTYLTSGSDAKLYATGGGDAPACAQAYEAFTSGSRIIEVFFWGAVSGCAVAAS